VSELGKILIGLGAVLLLMGVVFVLAGRANLPIGRLPGDMIYRGKHTVFYFPLATSIILSIVLSIIFFLVIRFSR